jgi:Domain of unknown function (DUF4349)/PKD domain
VNGPGGLTVRRALLILGAAIIMGGLAVGLVSNLRVGSNGGPEGTALPASNTASLDFSSGISPGTTQVVAADTSITTTANYVGTQANSGQGVPPQPNATSGSGGLLELSSDLSIQSSAPESTASAVAVLAYSLGGYVAYQATYTTSAYVVIRVPASQYQRALAKVEGLGAFVSIVSNSNDVTVKYTDLNATLASLVGEQGALLRLLNQSANITTTLAIESQLQGVNQQIDSIQSQILETRTLIDYSTLDVTISQGLQTSPLTLAVKAAPQSGTAPFSVTLDATVKGGSPPYVVNWNFGDGTADQGQILIHTYYQKGNYNVTATVTDQNGTAVSAWAMVHVGQAPGRTGVSTFFGNIANLFVDVVEGIVEVAVVALPLAAVGAAVVLPLRRRARPKDLKEKQ